MLLLDQINKRGTTIVMVTHAKDIVDRMGKRVIAIENGRIVRDEFGAYGFEEMLEEASAEGALGVLGQDTLQATPKPEITFQERREAAMIKRFFYTLKQAFLQVFRNRAMSLASIFAITAMLLILGIFFILVINVNTAAQTISQDYDSIEIFLKEDATTAQKDAIINDMKARDGVEDAYFKSKDTAMDEFKTRWGENAYLLDSLKDNPLPDSVVVLIADLEKADDIATAAGSFDGVEDVKFYKDTVDKLLDATRFIQIAAIVIMIFLIIVSIVVVSNTIKLTVFNRAHEISIMKYIGATNWFIRATVPGGRYNHRDHISGDICGSRNTHV